MTAVILLAEAVLQAAMQISEKKGDSVFKARPRCIPALARLTANEDQKLHQMIVDIRRTRTLEDEYVLIPDARVDLYARLESGKLADVARGQGDPQPVGDVIGEPVVRVTCEEGDTTGVSQKGHGWGRGLMRAEL
jgi:hypothetical protein